PAGLLGEDLTRLTQHALGRALPGFGAAELAVPPAQRTVGLGDVLLDLVQLAVQPGQFGGGRLKLALLGLELLGPVDHGLPVDLGELARLVQPGEDLPSLDRGVARPLVLPLLGRDLTDAGGQQLRLAAERGELALVGAAEDVPAPVVDPEPVILPVPPSAALDLAGPGDRPGQPAENRHRRDALEGRAPSELVL